MLPPQPPEKEDDHVRFAPWNVRNRRYVRAERVILKVVSERFRIPVDIILSKQRTYHVSRARAFVMFMAYTVADHSLNEIARQLKVDHTSVLHAIRKVNRALTDGDAVIAGEIDKLKKEFHRRWNMATGEREFR